MALPSESDPKEAQKAGDRPDDKDFDPSPEALIDEIDDERTLDEEEAIDGTNQVAVQEELDDLKRESEMPIEELLAYYERMRNEAGSELDESEEDDDEDEEEDEEEEDIGDINDDSAGDKNDRQDGGSSGSNKRSADGYYPDPKKLTPDSQTQSKADNSREGSDQTQNSSSKERTVTQPTTTDNSIQFQDREKQESLNLSSDGRVSDSASDQNRSISDSQPERRITEFQERRQQSLTNFMLDQDPTAMFQTLLNYDLDDSEDDDYSYTDDGIGDDERDWRRSIQVGPDHQAEIPEGLCEYGDLPPYQTEDKLIWRCGPNLTEEQILGYLKESTSITQKNDTNIPPASVPRISMDSMRLYRDKMQGYTSSQDSDDSQGPTEPLTDVYMSQSRKRVRIDLELEQETIDGPNPDYKEENSDSTSQDNRYGLSTEKYFHNEEQLLYLLLQCNYNIEEALRRRRLDPFKYYFQEPMSLWSQDECLGFEHGLRTYGKDFRQIRDNKVQTRTHAELVAFYYLWKKSERYDIYINQYKKDNLNLALKSGARASMFLSNTDTSTPHSSAPVQHIMQTIELSHQ